MNKQLLATTLAACVMLVATQARAWTCDHVGAQQIIENAKIANYFSDPGTAIHDFWVGANVLTACAGSENGPRSAHDFAAGADAMALEVMTMHSGGLWSNPDKMQNLEANGINAMIHNGSIALNSGYLDAADAALMQQDIEEMRELTGAP